MAIVPSCAIASASRARFLPKASSTFARDRAQHSEAAVIDQRYSPNLVELDFSHLRVKGIDTLLTPLSQKR